MVHADEYCREIESYLCRKNDGHLIRIVGPAFEQVTGWARDGIPLTVAFAGIDRYFERYYQQGARRRPVRIEFCEADIRDAFDDWRRVVGVVAAAAQPATDQDARPARGSSLASHLERVIARLTALRSSGGAEALRDTGMNNRVAELSSVLERIAREMDSMLPDARRRGTTRDALIARLSQLDEQLMSAAIAVVPPEEARRLATVASTELADYRSRMSAEAFARSHRAAVERLVRDAMRLPRLTYDG